VGEGARESGSLGDGLEVAQFLGTVRGIHDASGDGFDAEAADGRERSTSHGLYGEVGGDLDKRESVNALTTILKSRYGELVRGGASGSEDQDFRLAGVFRKKCGGAVEEFGRGAGTEERAGGHSPIIARALCALVGLGAGGWGLASFQRG